VYLTLAWVPAELTVTEVTFADADFDSAELAWPSMTEAKAFPFCNTEIFVAAEVFPLKNASQLVVIWLVAAELAGVLAVVLGLAAALGLALAVADGVAAGGELVPPLEQAASATAGIASAIAR
jgi:hypothetical protein